MNYSICTDGSWQIQGKHFQLVHAYPSIDGISIRPIRNESGADRITYDLAQGRLTCRFSMKDEQVVVSAVWEAKERIHDLELIGDACISFDEAEGSADKELRIFCQGPGMEGPSGLCHVSDGRHESDGLMALCHGKANLFLYVCDHRHYTNRYSIQQRDGVFDRPRNALTAGFNLEGTVKPGQSVVLSEMIICERLQGTLTQGLEMCAKNIAAEMGARCVKKPAYHWCSWYYHYQNMTQPLANIVASHTRYIQKETIKALNMHANVNQNINLVDNYRARCYSHIPGEYPAALHMPAKRQSRCLADAVLANPGLPNMRRDRFDMIKMIKGKT